MSESEEKNCNSFQNFMKKGLEFFKENQFKKAIFFLTEAIKIDENNPEALYFRGVSHSKLENFDDALNDFNKAIKIVPEFASPYNGRAYVRKRKRQYKEAIEDLDKYISLSPKDKSTYLINCGHIYFSSNNFEKALETFEKASELTLDKKQQEEVDIARAQTYRILDQVPKALEISNKIIELNPKSSKGYEERAKIHDINNEPQLSKKDFDKAIKLNPDNPFTYINRALLFRGQGLFRQALNDFQKATKSSSKQIQMLAHFQLGITYERVSQFDKALNEYDLVLSINPNIAHVHTHKGIIFGLLLEYDESLKSLNTAIKKDKTDLIAYLNRGIVLIQFGKLEEALNDFEEAIKIDPKCSYAYLGKAKTLCFLTKADMPYKQKKLSEKQIIKTLKDGLKYDKKSDDSKLIKWWIDFCKKYFDASEENRKRLRTFAEIYEETIGDKFFSNVKFKKNRWNDFLSAKKTIDKKDCYFLILRRWNSYTPVIPGEFHSNLGGGYFLVCEGTGTVIDPGYNFLENFIKFGFSLGDIDNVILTHAHDDHTADFESLLSLLVQCDKKSEKKIKLFSNVGAIVKFSNLLSKSEDFFEKITVLNMEDVYKLSRSLDMIATPTAHTDVLTEKTARGLVFKIKQGSKKIKVGITGDTKITANFNGKKLCAFFENMDLLISHIGSIHEKELAPIVDNFNQHKYEGQHLGIRGIVNLIFNCRPKIAIISEFGEELKQFRTTIADKIDNKFENFDSSGFTRVVPGDIGLKIDLKGKIKMSCEICNKKIKLDDIQYSDVLINNKIAFHCKKHKRNKIIEKFKKIEEEELRIRVENMGCTLELLSQNRHEDKFINEDTSQVS